MTERTHEERVQAWLDEAGDEPTRFGKAVIKVGRERGFPTLADDVSVLELERRHAVALADHMDGIDNRDEDDLCLAVAHALGLDPKEPEDQEAFLLRLAAAWT